MSLTPEIEELHLIAVQNQKKTYSDPATGFTVFTEYAHLKRGKCCGNVCRHCPYGWENAQRNNGERRQAKVASGDIANVDRLLRQIENGGIAEERCGGSSSPGHADGNESPCSGPEKKLKEPRGGNSEPRGKGGRYGGTLTSKNVPYTRKGDQGTAQLLTGERRYKSDDAFEAMGTVDELCSVVGVVHAELADSTKYGEFPEFLLDVMSRLFDIGSHVAKPKKHEEDEFQADGVGGGFDPHHTDSLEDWIDDFTEELPELSSFILPTGSRASAQLHVARTVCRRAERRVVSLVSDGKCDPNALKYLNRLSDFFFSAARFVNFKDGKQEYSYSRPHRGATQRNVVQLSLEPDEEEKKETR